jgi:hypothetical protein
MTPHARARFEAVRSEKIALVADYLATLPATLREAIGVAFTALDDLAVPPESVP